MNPEIESKIRRIEKISVWLRAGCTVLLVLTPLLFLIVVVALVANLGGATYSYYNQSIPIDQLTASGRMLLAVLSVLTGAVWFKGLYHNRRLLDNYTRREIFTLDSARQIRQFGYTCMFWAAVKLGWFWVPIVVMHSGAVKIDLPLDTFVVGGVIVVISWFTEMATAMREENELTV